MHYTNMGTFCMNCILMFYWRSRGEAADPEVILMGRFNLAAPYVSAEARALTAPLSARLLGSLVFFFIIPFN